MSNRGRSLDGIFFLQLAVALFLIVSGLLGLMDYTSKLQQLSRDFFRFFGFRSDVTAVIISVAELVSGTILFVGLFLLVQNRTLFFATLIVFALWTLRVVFYYFLNGFLKPDLLEWLFNLSPDLIILSSLWVIFRRYS